ncbi:hypothetical protein LJB86_00740 [Deltaproteobacteria bacterium OttesenSCG-928-M10]|nr:hypothetical protein [Deltaproteobacteria bacterium OttesenSCG-928-M10]
MSTIAQSDKPAARMAVKVPRPDSLVEVRVSPPDSNFEIKVTPGGDVIELLIRPGASFIEVRISPPGEYENSELAGCGESGRAWTEARPASPDEKFTAPESLEDPPEDLSAEDREEVVTGVSKAEFKAMVEEEEAAEAKKLLAELDADEPLDLFPAAEKSGYVLPEEAKQALEAVDDLDYLDTLEEPPAGQLEIEAEPVDQEEPEPALEPGDAEMIAAFAGQAEEDEPPADGGDDEPSLSVDEQTPDAPGSETPVDEDGPESEQVDTESDSPALNTGAREALARLSAAVQDEEPTGQQPAETPSAGREEPAGAALAVDASDTVMVEMIDDADPTPNLAAETASPLSDDEQMDLSSMEGDEELDIEPINVNDMEFDLEKSRPASGHGSPGTLRAKPMVKVNPANTIVPTRN